MTVSNWRQKTIALYVDTRRPFCLRKRVLARGDPGQCAVYPAAATCFVCKYFRHDRHCYLLFAAAVVIATIV